jgi:pyruvate carboxylase subunit B
MRTEDILPILEKLDNVGFFSLEVWGGATFDVCIRFLAEDPWDRLRKIRERVNRTKLQMLLRGQNLVGYKHYSDDVVVRFVKCAKRNGIDIFRIFDALNDIRNMETAIKVVKDEGAEAQGTICYTTSPVHTTEGFVELSESLKELGCDSICIKDMAGLISPKSAAELVSALKRIGLPISLHSHCTSGMAPLSYLSAVYAGVDILDTAFSPFSGGSSQPATETTVASLKGTDYETGISLEDLVEIGYYFLELREKYKTLISPIAERPDVRVLIHQIPGGMLSNFHSQLKEQNALDKYDEVLKETPKVREDLGYPPLVTPTSQIVGMQAVLNVLSGERYKKVTQEVKDYCLGLYGRPPGEINPDVRKRVIGEEEPVSCRPADLLEPQFEKAEEEAERLGIAKREEDVLTYALYPQIAVKFLRGEIEREPIPAPKELPPSPPKEFDVEVEGEVFRVKVSPVSLGVEPKERPKERIEGEVKAPMQGMVVSIKVGVGDKVKKGAPLLILEAMKMQTDVVSPYTGEVKQVYTFEGEQVSAGDILMVVQ